MRIVLYVPTDKTKKEGNGEGEGERDFRIRRGTQRPPRARCAAQAAAAGGRICAPEKPTAVVEGSRVTANIRVAPRRISESRHGEYPSRATANIRVAPRRISESHHGEYPSRPARPHRPLPAAGEVQAAWTALALDSDDSEVAQPVHGEREREREGERERERERALFTGLAARPIHGTRAARSSR